MRTLKQIIRTPWTLAAITLGVAALAGLSQPAPAKADIVLDAHLRLPHVRVDVRTPLPMRTLEVRHRSLPVRQLVIERRQIASLRPVDYQIASRMARLTGYDSQLLRELRRDGYTWWEIGRLLNIRKQVVEIALGVDGPGNHGHGHGNGHGNGHPRAFVGCTR